MDPSNVAPEPEVRFLARLATVGLLLVRVLLFGVGVAAIAGAPYLIEVPLPVTSEPAPSPSLAERIATHTTFLCFGLPLILPYRWTLERGRARRILLAVAAALVVVPMFFESNPLNVLIRILACGVGCAPILVWRTLWALR